MDRIVGSSCLHRLLVVAGLGLIATGSTAFASEPCGTGMYPFPYTDVAGVTDPFCPGIMEAYVTGVTKGTTPTTFSPNNSVSRVQMTTFLQRSLDQGVARASRRTAFKQLWQTNVQWQQVGSSGFPVFCAADGENIWVSAQGTVDQVQASTGKFLGVWGGATGSWPIVAIPGHIFTADNSTPGTLWDFNPSTPPGPVTLVSPLPGGASSIAFDGTNLWIANFSGSVSIYDFSNLNSYGTGFTHPMGVVYDGTHIWVTDYGGGKLFQLGPLAAIVKSVAVGAGPEQPVFDGENIWVPNNLDNSITVVQASSGTVVATIVSDGINKLSGPQQASFDGERILVTNHGGNSVTLFKAADLSVIANLSTGFESPYGACSDGTNFWVTFIGTGVVGKF